MMRQMRSSAPEPSSPPPGRSDPGYVGRFAPSPTGPLHFGSLVAALGSYLQARRRGGRWLLRIEDLDPPREVPGAAEAILRALEAYGLHWDGEVVYQSRRTERYREALEALRARGLAYPCACSRREVRMAGRPGPEGAVYPGTCRGGPVGGRAARAMRVLTHDAPIGFEDAVQGFFSQRLESEIGDFVIRRADGLYAYQLAVVVDDAEQGVTEVVRGADLLTSTPRQIHLQRLLGHATPAYAHLPVAVDARGAKLSKQTHARPLPLGRPVPLLRQALAFLGQPAPEELLEARVEELLAWAVAHWELSAVPRRPAIGHRE